LSKAIEAIANKDVKAVLSVVDDLISRGHDLRNFCRDLLALFRDLLVFKVAGGEQNLFEAAVFDSDAMKEMSANFGEADLIRFFNSLAETEASLREAAHPRYMLEIGLVKLLEMRELVSLEKVIERLDALSASAPLPAEAKTASTQAAAVSSATPEKKTLNDLPERVSEKASADVAEEPPDEYLTFDGELSEAGQPDEETSPTTNSYPQTRLAPLSSADLEHIPDPRLDDAYDEKLTFTGDNLLPIATAAKLAEAFSRAATTFERSAFLSGGSAAAAAPAMDVSSMLPDHVREPENVEIPTLSSDPTEAELRAYAEAHPAVRRAKRVFQAKIISVERA
jgi:DNA polymerase III gamma/tau subunit